MFLQRIIIFSLAFCTINCVAKHYHPDNSWPHKSLLDLKVFGSSIAIDKDENILLLHRGIQRDQQMIIPEPTLALISSKTGQVIKEWGANKFVKPHGLFITEDGSIFITDTILQQIFKFEINNSTNSWNEEPSLVIGEPYDTGKSETYFCGPSDVVEVPETGDFFVSDGYCNSRVMKFSKSGKFLLQFGSGGGGQNFNVSHGVALARNRILLVADRNNGRIQCFDLEGQFLYEIGTKVFGNGSRMIFSMATTNELSDYEFGELFVIDGNVEVGEQPRVFILGLNKNDATLIYSFPVSEEEVRPHDIAVTKDGKRIYIVETVWGPRIRKFVQVEEDTEGPESSANSSRGSCAILFVGVLVLIFNVNSFE